MYELVGLELGQAVGLLLLVLLLLSAAAVTTWIWHFRRVGETEQQTVLSSYQGQNSNPSSLLASTSHAHINFVRSEAEGGCGASLRTPAEGRIHRC